MKTPFSLAPPNPLDSFPASSPRAPNKNASLLRLALLAVAAEALWLISLFFTPWKNHIHAFLLCFFGAFAVYLAGWAFLNAGENEEKTPAPDKDVPAKPNAPLIVILLSGILFRLTVFLSPPSLSDDIYRYIWDGRVQNAGIHPYLYAPEDERLAFLRDETHPLINHPTIRTIYPPLAQGAFRLAALKPSVNSAKALFLSFDLATIFLLLVLLRAKRLPPERVFLYAWNPLVIVEFASSGHLDALGLFLLFAGLWLWEKGRNRAAGAAWGLSFLTKFAPVILLPWMLVKKRGRAALPLFVAVTAAGYAFFLAWPLMEIKGALFSGAVTYARDWYFNAGLYALLSWAAPAPPLFLKAGVAGALVLLAIVLARRWKDDRILANAGILVSASLALCPVVHPWYAVWIVPFLCFFPLRGGLAFSGAVALSYLVLDRYGRTGVWDLPAWIPWVEYGLAFGLLLWDYRARMKKTCPLP